MPDWTPEALYAHLTEALRLRDERIAAELAAIREAVVRAREAVTHEAQAQQRALEHRLEALNELRKTFESLDRSYAPALKLDALELRVDDLAKRQEKGEGVRIGAARLWIFLSGLPGLVAVGIAIWAALK